MFFPNEFTEKELLQTMNSSIPVISVRRIMRNHIALTISGYEHTKFTEIKSLGNEIPWSIRIYGLHFRIPYSVRKSKFCINCFFNTHISANFCSNRCFKCNGNNLSNSRNSPQDRPNMCINCKGNALSGSFFCTLRSRKKKNKYLEGLRKYYLQRSTPKKNINKKKKKNPNFHCFFIH